MDRARCEGCGPGSALDFDFTMAFQPIVDIGRGTVWGYEALVRGSGGEPAYTVLNRVTESNRYRFDQACRVKAIELAGRLFGRERFMLSINFMPNAVYEPSACIRASLQAADKVGFARDQLMFEFTENEKFTDTAKIRHIIEEYKKYGFVTALDDFGAGYAGLALLAAFQPTLVKIDMELIRDIHASRSRQAIVAGLVRICRELDVKVLAEGIENESECAFLRTCGITLMQGYHFARPAFEALPPVTFSVAQAA